MFCSKCGSQNIDDATFCVKCGADLTKQTPPEKKRYQDSLDGLGTSINQDSDIDFKVGFLFANRYEIITEGLKGGMGVVYKCKDTMLNKIKALKVIHPRLLNSKQAVSRFRQEVAISQELNHENIIRVYDLDVWDGKEYFTMEWVEGVTLREIITDRKKEDRPFSTKEAQTIISQLADALQHAHKYTIHRDIKPENILITRDKELKVKLGDFGIAKMLSPSQFTSTSMQMGTPYYMAPEQKTDAAHVDKRADIYSLGVVLFELLTLENTIGLEMPSEINKTLPKEIDNVIKKAVTTKPEDRYGDVKELSEALNKIAIMKAEKQQREAEDLRRQEAAEKTRLEAERIRLEEQRRIEEQRQKRTETKMPQRTEQKPSLNKVGIAAAAIVIIIIVAYIYNSKKETPSDQSVVSQLPVAVQQLEPPPVPAPSMSGPTPAPEPESVQEPVTASAPEPEDHHPGENQSNPKIYERPTGYIPLVNARVTQLLFFESGQYVPPKGQRIYSNSFAKSRSRYINYELNLSHPALMRRVYFNIDATWYQPDGSIFAKTTQNTYVEANWMDSQHTDCVIITHKSFIF